MNFPTSPNSYTFTHINLSNAFHNHNDTLHEHSQLPADWITPSNQNNNIHSCIQIDQSNTQKKPNTLITRGETHITLKFKDKTYIYDDQNGIRETINKSQLSHNFYKKNYQCCLNCNKKGHNYKTCRFPINSYGAIIFKECPDKKIRYLMIQRKYTSVYVELLRAKYFGGEQLNFNYFCLLISGLTTTERYYICNYDFDYLWHSLWRWVGTDEQMQCIFEEYENCKQKFNYFKKGYNDQQHGFITFQSLFHAFPETLIEPDWEFPKGRRCLGESDQECAIRECCEETTLTSEDYHIFLHVKPFQEKFVGVNQKKYCNNYYLAELVNHNKHTYYDPNQVQQNTEIRKIGWFTQDQIKKLVNDNQQYRIKMIFDVDHLVTNLKKIKRF